ncbi:MAG TPA: hypothetical protein VIF64_06675 [Pyrinomonadaceae bacterium]
MLESTRRESSEPETAADSEATSKETVRDLEENEEDVASGSSKRDPGPSPDGTLDRSDEKNDAGPM